MASPGVTLSEAHAAWLLQHRRRWPLCLCALLSGVLAAYAFTVGLARQRALDRLPKTEAQLRALQPKPIPDAENAAVVYRKAFDAMTAPTPADPDRHGTPCSDGDAKWHLLEDEQYVVAAREVLSKSGGAMRLGERASQMPSCNWENDYTSNDMPHAGPMWRLAKLYFARAGLAFREGNPDEAERDLRTLLRMAEHLLTDRRMGSVLSAMRLRAICRTVLENGLESVDLTPTQLDRWRSIAQAEADWKPPFGDVIEAEKLFVVRLADLMSAGKARKAKGSWSRDPTAQASEVKNIPVLLGWYGLIYESERRSCEYLATELRRATEASLNASAPLDERHLQKEIRRSQLRFELLTTQFSILSIPPVAVLQCRTGWRLTFVALTALRWRRANGNVWPKELEQLGLPAQDLRDPFNREKGRVRWKVDAKSGDLWLWSVGRDGRDESTQYDVNDRRAVEAWRDRNILFHIPATVKREAQKP